MFLVKLFKKSNKSANHQRDYLKFTIDTRQNIPKYQEQTNPQGDSDDFRITSNHPLYSQIFPSSPSQNQPLTYTATHNDSFTGIAMKLGVSQGYLRSINNISGQLCPGTAIQIPPGYDAGLLRDERLPQIESPTLGNVLESEQLGPPSENRMWGVGYNGGSVGVIHGTLTANRNYIIFSPSLQHPPNLHKLNPQQLLKYNVIIQTSDIEEVRVIEPDRQGQLGRLMFILMRIGNPKFDKKKNEKETKAAVNFSAYNLSPMQEQISALIQQGKSNSGQQAGQRAFTTIPCFELLSNEEGSKSKEVISPTRSTKGESVEVPRRNKNVGSLQGPSTILSEEAFYNLAQSIPVLYQHYNWSRIYNSTKDGSSFNTFLNKAKNAEPAIFLLKQYKGYTMGAFLIQSLQTGKTGRGEMFIFTFKDSDSPQVYKWTGKNQTFVVCEKGMGLGIGMGFKYGIFMKPDMDKGSSCSTYTFGNSEILSKKEDFLVDQVQLWAVDSSF